MSDTMSVTQASVTHTPNTPNTPKTPQSTHHNTEGHESDQHLQFKGEICDARRLIPMLKAIQIKKTTVMAITNYGLKMTCQEEGKCLQATSFVERSLFTHYWMRDESQPMTLCFRLNDLLNVLEIFTSPEHRTRASRATSLSRNTLRITCCGQNRPLILELSDDTTETKAKIIPFNVEELIMFNIDFVNKIILNSEAFIDFWRCADMNSDWIEISINDCEPYLQFATESERAKVNHIIDKTSENIEFFQCSFAVKNRYKMSLIKQSIKALLNSSKLSIRTNTDGLLSLQFMIKLDETHENCFVEYYLMPFADNIQQ